MSPTKLPKAGPEPPQNRDLSSLEPDAAQVLIAFILEAARQGIPLMVVEAARTFARQAWLFSIGREFSHPTSKTPMKILTKAAAGHSNHERRRAADLVPVLRRPGPDGKWITIADWESPHWPTLAKIAKGMGLVWGGDFPELHDKPHFEVPAGKASTAIPLSHTPPAAFTPPSGASA
jgi:peptidoglycan L-alanyl-D-glutamate endopeptidase CwlK